MILFLCQGLLGIRFHRGYLQQGSWQKGAITKSDFTETKEKGARFKEKDTLFKEKVSRKEGGFTPAHSQPPKVKKKPAIIEHLPPSLGTIYWELFTI